MQVVNILLEMHAKHDIIEEIENDTVPLTQASTMFPLAFSEAL